MTIDRRTFLTMLAAGGATLACPRPARAKAWRPALPSWGMPETLLEWKEIHEGAFVMVDMNTGGNTLVLGAKHGALLVDTKFPFLGAALRQDALTLTEAPALTLINTHHHGDHTGGNAAFLPKDPIYAHEKAIARVSGQLGQYVSAAKGGPGQLSRAGASEALLGLATDMAKRADDLTPEDFTPTHALAVDGMLVEFGDRRVKTHHFGPGHTDNDVVVVAHDINLVHTGDLVFSGLHPYFDPPGGATAAGWLKSLEATFKLCDEETVVVPGHGVVGDRSIITAQIDYMSQLLEAVRKDIDAGVSKEDAQAKTYPFMEGLGFEQARARAIGAVYDELVGG
ncbi:MAG: MBL fold metallo-hydrolase [Phycisphaerales bacterium]